MERIVKHDLNNVFSTIITYADLLMQDLEPESTQFKFAEAIFQSGVQAMESLNGDSVSAKQPDGVSDNIAMRSQKHLLIVDDQPDILAAMQIILEQSGYRTGICSSVDEMDAALTEHQSLYDLIFLDESMPDEQGHVIARRLDRDYPHVPIVVVTGYGKEDIVPLTTGIANIRGIVEKPEMITELVTTADRILL